MSEINKISKMSFSELLKIEFMKCKRSKIVPLIFIAPLLVVSSGIANLSSYFLPEIEILWLVVAALRKIASCQSVSVNP